MAHFKALIYKAQRYTNHNATRQIFFASTLVAQYNCALYRAHVQSALILWPWNVTRTETCNLLL